MTQSRREAKCQLRGETEARERAERRATAAERRAEEAERAQRDLARELALWRGRAQRAEGAKQSEGQA